jgi:hypothetical protein
MNSLFLRCLLLHKGFNSLESLVVSWVRSDASTKFFGTFFEESTCLLRVFCLVLKGIHIDA